MHTMRPAIGMKPRDERDADVIHERRLALHSLFNQLHEELAKRALLATPSAQSPRCHITLSAGSICSTCDPRIIYEIAQYMRGHRLYSELLSLRCKTHRLHLFFEHRSHGPRITEWLKQFGYTLEPAC